MIDSKVLAKALVRIAEYVLVNGITGNGDYQSARDLLMLEHPRISGQTIKQVREDTLTAAMRVAPILNSGVFPVQGPPGAGKTHTGARMTCTLVQAGKRVGVTANSHKVIRNLLDEVLEAADELAVPLKCIQKPSEIEDDLPRLQFTTDNDELLTAIRTNCQVVGATAWFWARPDAFELVDVLFIDEAAQMSLAMSWRCRKRPRQLYCSATQGNLSSQCRGATRKGQMFPRSIISSVIVRLFPPTVGCF